MPAYFSVTFEFYKSQDAVRTFCEALIHSGLVFKSGCWEYEKDSFEDIITWNQGKLDADFELGYTQHYLQDYKQMQFYYFDFSEVRLFITNTRGERTFSFELIIPEADLREYTREKDGNYFEILKPGRMEPLISAVKEIWADTSVLAIQTGWEGSAIPPSAEEIAGGTWPQIEPFCIIHSSYAERKAAFTYECIGRNGLLIEDKVKWNCQGI